VSGFRNEADDDSFHPVNAAYNAIFLQSRGENYGVRPQLRLHTAGQKCTIETYKSLCIRRVKGQKSMLRVGISEFRSNMNSILQKVQDGEIVSLQVRGTEVAKLVPSHIASDLAMAELERIRKTAYVGDVLSPIDEKWEVVE